MKYSISNQRDFDKVYPTLSVKDRGLLGRAYPEYYQNYINSTTSNYNNMLSGIKDFSNKVNEFFEPMMGSRKKAIEKDTQTHIKAENKLVDEKVNRDLNLAISGRANNSFKPWTQEDREKYKAKQTKTIPNANIKQIIINEAMKQGVDPQLALAIAQHESGFNPNALGDSGKSQGLFQIHTTAHPDYKGGFDPQKNAEYGIRFLKGLLDKYGDVKTALRAYNGGHGGIKLPQTERYANTVLGIYNNNQPVVQKTSPTPQSEDIPQSSQNAPQPILNRWKDVQYLNQISPALNWQQIASDISQENPKAVYNISSQNMLNDLYNKVQGNQPQVQQTEEQNNMSMNAPTPFNPYDLGDIRGYAKIDNQPQAQNINPDIMNSYIQLMSNIQQPQINYGQIQADFNKAYEADQRQNQMNAFINAIGSLGTPSERAPIYYVGANGDLRAIKQDQPNKIEPLPTNMSSNVDKYKVNLGLQQAQAKANLEALKNSQDLTSNMLQAQAFSNKYGGDPMMFLDPKVREQWLQSIVGAEASQRAQFEREKGLIPYQTQSNIAQEQAKTAGQLSVEDIKGKYDLGKQSLANQGQAYTQGIRNAGNVDVANILAQNREQIAQMEAANRIALLKQQGANQQALARLEDDLYSNNPLRKQQAYATLFGSYGNFASLFSSEQGLQQGLQNFNNYFNAINNGVPYQTTDADANIYRQMFNQ